MKGGYQIVEIGTGIVGMYDKLKAAYEAKKPILVKKNGIKTFGNVTKDGNYFVANYIIDDVLHQDTISALDAITDSSIDIGGSAGDIEAIDERISKNKINTTATNGWVQITSYDGSTEDKFFVCPNDGYIHATAGTANTNGVEIALSHSKTKTGSVTMIAVYGTGASRNSTASIFVRKGQIVYVATASGTYDAHFAPLS